MLSKVYFLTIALLAIFLVSKSSGQSSEQTFSSGNGTSNETTTSVPGNITRHSDLTTVPSTPNGNWTTITQNANLTTTTHNANWTTTTHNANWTTTTQNANLT